MAEFKQGESGECLPHSGDLRKGRWFQPYGLYYVTKCLLSGMELSDNQKDEIVQAILHFRSKGRFQLHAFVVMPDHWHGLLSMSADGNLGRLMHDIDYRSSYLSRKAGLDIPWQEEFHDHKLREVESVVDVVRYIEANPVRLDLVECPSDWLWSSANERYLSLLDRSFLGYEKWQNRSERT